MDVRPERGADQRLVEAVEVQHGDRPPACAHGNRAPRDSVRRVDDGWAEIGQGAGSRDN